MTKEYLCKNGITVFVDRSMKPHEADAAYKSIDKPIQLTSSRSLSERTGQKRDGQQQDQK